ncbi:MAG: hypothetical protein ABSC05_24390 [Candidatus Solibacter sp.]
MPAAKKGTAFRRTNRTDLNWIFTVRTERDFSTAPATAAVISKKTAKAKAQPKAVA